jgi:hypothetical protein
MQSGFVEKTLNVLFAPQNRQASWFQSRITDRHSILRAQIHTRYIHYLKPLRWMFLVLPLHAYLSQLRQRTQVRVALQLLLAFATGKQDVAFPGRRIRFENVGHPPVLDAHRACTEDGPP